MGILSRFFNYKNSDFIVWNGGNVSSSGEVINDITATNIATVYACVRIKSEGFAKNPIHLYRKVEDGRERVLDHPIANLIERRPNNYQTPYIFKRTLAEYQNFDGEAIIRMEFAKNGKPVGLHFLNPKMTKKEWQNGKRFFIETDSNKVEHRYSEDEILYLPYMLVNGEAKSPLTVARENAGILIKQQKFIGKYYANGTLSRGLLKTEKSVNKDAKLRIKEEWAKANSGIDQAHSIPVLDSDFSFQSMQLSVADSEWLATAKYQIADICRIFGVPPHMISELDRSTFSNIEMQSMEFIQNTIMPMVISFEEEINNKLFSVSEQKQGYYVKCNMTASLRGDSQSRGNFYKTGIEGGWFSVNDIRRYEDLPPIAGGDTYLRSLNYIDSNIADEYQLSKANSSSKGGE